MKATYPKFGDYSTPDLRDRDSRQDGTLTLIDAEKVVFERYRQALIVHYLEKQSLLMTFRSTLLTLDRATYKVTASSVEPQSDSFIADSAGAGAKESFFTTEAVRGHPSAIEVKRTQAAAAFISEYGLEAEAEAAVKALRGSFSNIKQARLEFDPGDEEEDDHPWIRVYVQTEMDASSTLQARKQFYKALNRYIPRDKAAYFHLAFRVVANRG